MKNDDGRRRGAKWEEKGGREELVSEDVEISLCGERIRRQDAIHDAKKLLHTLI